MENAIAARPMNDLSTTEQASLERYEGLIKKGLASFYEVGSALLTIRDSRLYRGTHGTFEAYCLDRWGMTDRHARRLMGSAAVVENVKSGPIGPVPASESVARPMTKLTPEEQSSAWKQSWETAPDGKVTAAHVYKIVKGMTGEKPETEKEEESDAVFQLKRWWKKATIKDKKIFKLWIEEGKE